MQRGPVSRHVLAWALLLPVLLLLLLLGPPSFAFSRAYPSRLSPPV